MGNKNLLKRIAFNPQIFGGKPIIRGMRIKVENILALLEQGVTPEEILADYPDLETEDIRACLAYARLLVANESIDQIEAEVAR
ncbi:MAG: hypothetical protein STSR0004_22660 [Peptococcaceae bacterium]